MASRPAIVGGQRITHPKRKAKRTHPVTSKEAVRAIRKGTKTIERATAEIKADQKAVRKARRHYQRETYGPSGIGGLDREDREALGVADYYAKQAEQSRKATMRATSETPQTTKAVIEGYNESLRAHKGETFGDDLETIGKAIIAGPKFLAEEAKASGERAGERAREHGALPGLIRSVPDATIAVLPVAGKGARLTARAAAAGRTERALSAAEKAKLARTKAIPKVKPTPKVKVPNKATPKPKPTAKGTPKPTPKPKSAPKRVVNRGKDRVKNRYSSPERGARRAKRSERLVHRATSPVLPTAASDSDVADRLDALVEGHANANIPKSLLTTAKAIPATFSFGATVAGDTIESIKQGSLDPLKGSLDEAKGAITQLAPLVSGDPEKVEKAIEDDVGYVLAPLAPRGFVSKPAKAAGQAIVGGGKVVGRRIPGFKPEQVAARASRATKPNKAHAAAQIVTGKKYRKRTAQIFSEPRHETNVHSAHARQRIDKKGRKVKDNRSLANLQRDIAGEDVIPTLINFGIGRKNTLQQLRNLLRSLDPKASKAINVRAVMAYVEKHPEILKDAKAWETVDQGKIEGKVHETSDVAKYRGQAQMLSHRFPEGEGPSVFDEIVPPERAVPMRAREHTNATDRQAAWKDVEGTRKGAGELRKAADKADVEARVLRAEVKMRVKDLRRRRKEQKPSKGPDEVQAAVEGYVKYGELLNEGLRGSMEISSKARDIIARVDRAFEVAPKLPAGTLYRGMNLPPDAPFLKTLTPGAVIKGEGFTSLTPIRKAAEKFADRSKKRQAILLEVNVPKGTSGLDLTKWRKEPTNTTWAEREVLFPRDSALRIDSVSTEGGRIHVRATAMPVLRPGRDVRGMSGHSRLVEDPVLNRKLDQLLDLEANARGLRAEAKAGSRRAKALHRELDPYTRGDRLPTIKARRKHADPELNREFVETTKARAAEAGAEEPGWTSEPRLGNDPGTRTGGQQPGPNAVHIKTGEAARTDVADRSYEGWLHKTIHMPYVRKGLARGVRHFVHEMSETRKVNGKTKNAFSSDELVNLHDEGSFDPRTHIAIDKRQIAIHLKDKDFDLDDFHSKVAEDVRKEFDKNDLKPGSSYIIVPREAGLEFMDQVNPHASRVEAITGMFGMATSRIVLNSPAWLQAQTAATGFVAMATQGFNPVTFARDAWAAERLRALDPTAYEKLLARAGGAGPSVDTPHSHRLSNDPITGMRARRGLNSTFLGRRIDEVATQRTFALMDRWQTGKWRTAALVGYLRKEANKAERARLAKNLAPEGMQPYLAEQAKIAEALKGKTREEALQWWTENPRRMDSITQKMRDTQGDWHTYSRFEKEFAGLFIFYPFIRMSLTWPTRFAKHHPLVAESLYLLAQSNNKELEKLFNDEDMKFLEYANAVVHGGPNGEVSADIPSARRFATPALNAVTEAAGSANSAGLFRALNPALAAPIYAVGHIDPFTGEHSDESVGDSLRDQFLVIHNAFRELGIGKDEPSPISQELDETDPERKERSLWNVFDARPAEAAQKYKDITDDLTASHVLESEYTQWKAMVDELGLEEAKRQLKAKYEAGDDLSKLDLPEDPEGDAEYKKLSEILYRIKYGTRKAKRDDGMFGGGSSMFGGGGNMFGGGGGMFK